MENVFDLEDVHQDDDDDKSGQSAGDTGAGAKGSEGSSSAAGSKEPGKEGAKPGDNEGSKDPDIVSPRNKVKEEGSTASGKEGDIKVKEGDGAVKDAEGDNKSAMELFLADYNLVDGLVPFKDGSKVHINDMSPEQQLEVLNHLAKSSRPSVEQEYDLSTEEIDILNKMRKDHKTFDQLVKEEVEKRVLNDKVAEQFKGDVAYEKWEADKLYSEFLKRQDPDASEEDLKEQLEVAKKSPRYDKVVENIRAVMVEDREEKKNQFIQKEQQKDMAEIEADRTVLVTAATAINDIAGWQLTDDMRNEVLESLIEVDADGDSRFISEVLSDPERLFRVAWLDKYGEQMFEHLDDLWKKELKEIYKKYGIGKQAPKEQEEFEKKKANKQTLQGTKDQQVAAPVLGELQKFGFDDIDND